MSSTPFARRSRLSKVLARLCCVAVLSSTARPVYGADMEPKKTTAVQESSEPSSEPKSEQSAEKSAAPEEESPYRLKRNPDDPRSDIGVPILSFILPGFGQWKARQYLYASLYTGAAVVGYGYSLGVAYNNGYIKKDDEDKANESADSEKKQNDGIDSKDINGRKMAFGQQIAQSAGGLSAYHSFRTAVRSRKHLGQYEFLGYEESPSDLLLAPFDFRYMARPTTFIPLAIGAGLGYLMLKETPEDYEKSSFTQADAFFSAGFSYNAGTHEEAMFRGWIMPVMNNYWHSPFWSNAAQSAVFAAAHLNTVSVPLAQLLLGYHLGYVTQKRGWQIGESIFIHVWWDVLAFASLYHYKEKLPDDEKERIRPVLNLPPLQYFF
jgi:hypothetical protein